ncbi:MAG: hypothetical protein KGD63_04615 [Candidatus Lokiarchaeota archaeon]|nr:hypothetical protein [Candidatus Lokiarchaeota archaeon]
MARRMYIRGKKTHAKDESFKKDNVGDEKERFQINIDLMSLKTLKDYDIAGWIGEFYLKCDGEDKLLKSRFPDHGVLKLAKHQTFTSKADMTLWSQFETVWIREEKSIKVEVELREKDHLKKDESIAKEIYEIPLPQPTKYVILQDKKGNTKAKLRIQSTRTRY